MTYFSELASAKDKLVDVLAARGIQSRYLQFGGEEASAPARVSVPVDARSEFLANRAMGDWAEGILATAMGETHPEWRVSHYGNSERMAAGDPGFRKFYLRAMDEVRAFGKRPDLLVFRSEVDVPENMSEMPANECEPFVRRAIAAIEVRSSKYEALRYMRVRQAQRAAGARPGRDTPSFTVKVEDLKIVYRWIERFQIPQSYCQVFFDSIYGMNFLDIFRLIASETHVTIENPARSQQKTTIMIPITCGECVGKFATLPTFKVEERVTELGRHDAYVRPQGGRVVLDPGSLRSVLLR